MYHWHSFNLQSWLIDKQSELCRPLNQLAGYPNISQCRLIILQATYLSKETVDAASNGIQSRSETPKEQEYANRAGLQLEHVRSGGLTNTGLPIGTPASNPAFKSTQNAAPSSPNIVEIDFSNSKLDLSEIKPDFRESQSNRQSMDRFNGGKTNVNEGRQSSEIRSLDDSFSQTEKTERGANEGNVQRVFQRPDEQKMAMGPRTPERKEVGRLGEITSSSAVSSIHSGQTENPITVTVALTILIDSSLYSSKSVLKDIAIGILKMLLLLSSEDTVHIFG